MDGGAVGRTTGAAPAGAAGLLAELHRTQEIVARWAEPERAAAEAHAAAVESLNAEAFRRLIAALKTEPAAAVALRAAAADEVVYAVLRRHGILKPSLTERIALALESVRPMLAAHDGDVEIVAVVPPAVEIRLIGACDGCPASALTLHAGVRQAILDRVPEITEVRQARGTTAAVARPGPVASPFVPEPGWVFVCAHTELADRETRIIERGGISLLLTRLGDGASCFENACAHMGLDMTDGACADGRIVCPHHGFEYDLTEGACLSVMGVGLRPVPVRVEGGRIFVRPGG